MVGTINREISTKFNQTAQPRSGENALRGTRPNEI
jgi:hypothetical protein